MSYSFIKRSMILVGITAGLFLIVYAVTKEAAFLFLGIITAVGVVWLRGIQVDMREVHQTDEFDAFVTEELEESYCKN